MPDRILLDSVRTINLARLRPREEAHSRRLMETYRDVVWHWARLLEPHAIPEAEHPEWRRYDSGGGRQHCDAALIFAFVAKAPGVITCLNQNSADTRTAAAGTALEIAGDVGTCRTGTTTIAVDFRLRQRAGHIGAIAGSLLVGGAALGAPRCASSAQPTAPSEPVERGNRREEAGGLGGSNYPRLVTAAATMLGVAADVRNQRASS